METRSAPWYRRKAAEVAPDRRVVAGIMANLGALMMGAPGALDRALEYTATAIQAGVEANMRDSDIVGGKAQCFSA